MSEDRVPCKACEAMVLKDTASRTGGHCMPCYKKGPKVTGVDFVHEFDPLGPFKRFGLKIGLVMYVAGPLCIALAIGVLTRDGPREPMEIAAAIGSPILALLCFWMLYKTMWVKVTPGPMSNAGEGNTQLEMKMRKNRKRGGRRR